MSAPILVVEDRPALAEMLAETLRREGYATEVVLRGDEAVERLGSGTAYLAVLTDLKLPGADGLAVLRAARGADRSLPVFLVTAYATVDTAVAALKEGARDYFAKPLDMERVLAAVWAAAEPRRALLDGSAHGADLPEIVGSAPAFATALAGLRRVAPTDAAVLLTGPSGTGKELFARAVHRLSRRRDGPLVAFNCAAVPETLVEAELFGYERGAFTGATARHLGRFEQAAGGTLFLDEIGEIPPGTQAKLLRALEERRVTRLGGTGEVVADVRVVAATNRDLEVAVETGDFRRDLFHRLNVFPIAIPPLAQRRTDIPALAVHLLARAAERHGIDVALRPSAMAALVLAPWPGNVRELANLLERAAILAGGERIGVGDLDLEGAPCLEALADEQARRLVARLVGEEAPLLADFLGLVEDELQRRLSC